MVGASPDTEDPGRLRVRPLWPHLRRHERIQQHHAERVLGLPSGKVMRFNFTDEQDVFRDTVRELFADRCPPTPSDRVGTMPMAGSPACGMPSVRWACWRCSPRSRPVSACPRLTWFEFWRRPVRRGPRTAHGTCGGGYLRWLRPSRCWTPPWWRVDLDHFPWPRPRGRRAWPTG